MRAVIAISLFGLIHSEPYKVVLNSKKSLEQILCLEADLDAKHLYTYPFFTYSSIGPWGLGAFSSLDIMLCFKSAKCIILALLEERIISSILNVLSTKHHV